MRLRVRLFARLRDLAGTEELERDAAERSDVGAVWRALVSEIPALAAYSGSVSAAVNADYARMDTPVHDGDEVAFLPPVSGG
jgi:molybdopterin converting factor subunit 1